jgi:voltage-gated sodium channel
MIMAKGGGGRARPKPPRVTEIDDDLLDAFDDPEFAGDVRYEVTSHSLYLQPYIYLANFTYRLTRHIYFEMFVMSAVVFACLLVGCQTYPEIADRPELAILEHVVLGVFCMEIVLKIIAEGPQPWRYFTAGEFRWNWFDFTIVLLSLPNLLPSGGLMLRLMRLARLGKLFKQFPEVMVIVMGLIGGLKSIGSIMFLLLFVYYLYAMVGMSIFRVNDPFHFDTLKDTFLTLYRCSTMEDWTDVMYINIYGCDLYPGGTELYATTEAEVLLNSEKWLCAEPHAQPGLAVGYFVSFTLTGGFVMLSMFVGAVTLAMSDSVEHAREQKVVDAQRKKRKRLTSLPASQSDEEDRTAKLCVEERRELNQISALVKTAWDGQPHEPEDVIDPRMKNPVLRGYYFISIYAKQVVELTVFRAWIMALIVLAGILIGLESDNRLTEADKPRVSLVETVIKGSFTVECVLKIIAECFR